MTTADLRKQLAEIRQRADSLGHSYAPRSLPAFAWPGGYSVFYLDGDGEILCANCATEMLDDEDRYGRELPITSDVYWEGPSLFCAECNWEITSAYGDPDVENGVESAGPE